MAGVRRFTLRIDPWIVPLVAPWGVFGSRRVAIVDERWLGVSFGFWRQRFPRDQIVSARRVKGHFPWGIGWHSDFFRRLTVNGSLGGLVEIQFATPQAFRLLGIPGRCTILRTSLEEPDAFVEALSG